MTVIENRWSVPPKLYAGPIYRMCDEVENLKKKMLRRR